MNKEIVKGRVREIRGRMSKKRIKCLIVTHKANVSYCTGFLGDDSWAVISRGGVYLITDSRYTEQAQKECAGCKIIERAEPMAEAAAKLVKRFKSVHTVYIEKSSSVSVLESLDKHVKGKVKAVGGIIETVREYKNADEARAIRTAGRTAMKALKISLKFARAGISENELAGRIDFEIRKLGAVISFDTIVAFGANASRPHHQPGPRKLKKNDTMLIDFGVKFNSYCCDITRCFIRGKPSAFYKSVYEAVKEAQAAAIKEVRDGVSKLDVDSAAREVIAGYDLPVYGHGTGHGLGMEIHEEPYVKDKSKGKLREGQVITIEPGVYIPGNLGVRIEDDILVTKRGCEVLTKGLKKPF